MRLVLLSWPMSVVSRGDANRCLGTRTRYLCWAPWLSSTIGSHVRVAERSIVKSKIGNPAMTARRDDVYGRSASSMFQNQALGREHREQLTTGDCGAPGVVVVMVVKLAERVNERAKRRGQKWAASQARSVIDYHQPKASHSEAKISGKQRDNNRFRDKRYGEHRLATAVAGRF
ncbi:hypothetical protein QBC37DRAFT_35759 [Rhypophila decipiens]|uniref:Uncharacterized protein n=1 Tax=Rhypophila decipiens TaxID=261697 RepID=A0AAN6Y0I5_9PEZI|nr:hypothetical protein QBC37DRAFT_35759 [Rhypophila decipiens]